MKLKWSSLTCSIPPERHTKKIIAHWADISTCATCVPMPALLQSHDFHMIAKISNLIGVQIPETRPKKFHQPIWTTTLVPMSPLYSYVTFIFGTIIFLPSLHNYVRHKIKLKEDHMAMCYTDNIKVTSHTKKPLCTVFPASAEHHYFCMHSWFSNFTGIRARTPGN